MVVPPAQSSSVTQPQPSAIATSTSSSELLKDLPSNMSNLQIKDPAPRTSSRLVQWKLPSPDRDGSDAGSLAGDDLNKAPGTKASPSPSLQPKSDGGLPFSDSTWSTIDVTSVSSWPGSTSEPDTKSITSNDSNDLDTDGDGDKGSLDIEEFVPGKQWRGAAKTAEDDPFLTPGDLNRSFSVNTVKEDYITSTFGNKTGTSPTPLDSSTQWSSVGNLSKQKWASPAEMDLWGGSAKTRPPPGLTSGVSKGGPWPRPAPSQNFHRSTSWAPGDRASTVGQGEWLILLLVHA
jgi:hypothetical protein